MPQTRPEFAHVNAIDGLRALAVVTVLLFHLDEHWLAGGFVGVDIFFVISGFVVARSVLAVPDSMGFLSFVGWFYRRRVSRIFPALFVVVVVGSLLSVLFIPATQTSRFFEWTGAASLIGVSNFLLLIKAGDYFSQSSSYNPFTHTWSLAVEEQYYMVFPVFAYLIIIRRGSREGVKLAWLLLVLFAFASLVACARLTSSWRDFAFYMLPTRFWELAAGFSLSYLISGSDSERSFRPWALQCITVLGWLGVTTIAVAILEANALSFPFPWALPVVIATCALISSFALVPEGMLARLFSLPWVRYIGRISYSLYLWHWVTIVLFRWTVGVGDWHHKVAVGAISLLLAALSVRFVEDPVRYSARLRAMSGVQYFLVAVTALIVGLGVVAGLTLSKIGVGLSAVNQVQLWSPYATPGKSSASNCLVERSSTAFLHGFEIDFVPSHCSEAGGKRLYVLGDSHAGAYERMFFKLASERGYTVKMVTAGGCKFLGELDRNHTSECEIFRARSFAKIMSAARAGDYLFLPGLYVPRFRDWWDGSDNKARSPITFAGPAAMELAVAGVIGRLSPAFARGLHVIFEAPKPVLGAALFRCADWFSKDAPYCAVGVETDALSLKIEARPILNVLQAAAAKESGSRVFDPFDLLCPGPRCSGYLDGRPLFFDTDHLSAYGNDIVYPRFEMMLRSIDG